MTRAILFDIDGVLVHSLFHPDSSLRREWHAHLFADLGVTLEENTRFFTTAFRDVMLGRNSIVTALDAFLPTTAYRGSTLDFVAYWLKHDTQLNIPLLNAVKRLRAKGNVQLYLATNQDHSRALYLWNELKLGHVFDDIFYAARFGIAKPDPSFFERIEAAIGPQSETPLFFDDSSAVIDAARTFGWDGVLYNHLADFTGHDWVKPRLA